MDLIFFDLDGTLLNKSSELSAFTRETLNLLKSRGIAHTVATGRTLTSGRRVLGDHSFELPHIYSNGVTVWDPRDNVLTLENVLNHSEVDHVVECALKNGLAPFINTVEKDEVTHQHAIFHGQLHHQVERDLLNNYFSKSGVTLLPLGAMPPEHHVTNISMIGANATVSSVYDYIASFDSLIAYSGPAAEGDEYSWIDIHHRLANKGSAVLRLKEKLGASNIICFGDSDNDLSMFALADECYAPDNAKESIKEVASAVIGHHHEDGVARFLRERFAL